MVTAVAVPATWEPPSATPPPARRTAEACPDCGGDLYTTGRGTLRVCFGECHRKVTPPGVRAPYERGTSAGRQVKSQRERDLDALGLARRKGVMLSQLDDLDRDDRLDPESRPVVEWFAEQVRSAGTAARLDELAALLPDAGIQRRGRWRSVPVSIEAAEYDDDQDDDDDDQDDDDQDDDDEGTPVAVLAIPAGITTQPRRATWAEALAARGWRLTGRDDSGVCQVSSSSGRCTQPIGGHPPVTDRFSNDGWTCSGHYYELGKTISAINSERGLT